MIITQEGKMLDRCAFTDHHMIRVDIDDDDVIINVTARTEKAAMARAKAIVANQDWPIALCADMPVACQYDQPLEDGHFKSVKGFEIRGRLLQFKNGSLTC